MVRTAIRCLHPQYPDLIVLLDQSISRLLIRPTPLDVSLDSIRALLLYAQWMPFNHETHKQRPPKSRYNDVSAWSVQGLAGRYAVFLGLESAAISPLHGPFDSITEDDLSRMRVWLNILTCDCNLMLTSGLPAPFDSGPTAAMARIFGSHPQAQQPSDLRVAALVELVHIANRAIKSSGDVSGRHLNASSLKRANLELDDWERWANL